MTSLRFYNSETGNQKFFLPVLPFEGNEEDAFVSIGFNAGVPQKTFNSFDFQKYENGVAGAFVEFRGYDPEQDKVSVWRASWGSLVQAIVTRCKKTGKFSIQNSGAKRSARTIYSGNKQRGIFFYSLPCANGESAGVEIILSLPQGFELFVAGEKKLSLVPDSIQTKPQNDGKLQFKTFNEKTGCGCCAEVGLTEFLQLITAQDLEEVEGETSEAVFATESPQIMHNQLFIDEVTRNPQSERVGAIWHFYNAFLNTKFNFILGGKAYNKKISFKLNMLFAWIVTRSFGSGYTKKISDN